MKKTILILGINGFIGNSLLRKLLLDDKYVVYGMDINDDNLNNELLSNKKFTFVEGDININYEWIEYHIKKCKLQFPTR